MKYGDFSSLVQLGVGLHVGTALLQLYGELGVQPLVRTIARIKTLFIDAEENEQPPAHIKDELEDIESSYEIFKIQLFNEYKNYVKINSANAFILVVILTIITYKASDPITGNWIWITLIIVSLSILPAPITLLALWRDATRQVKPMKERADALEERALQGK